MSVPYSLRGILAENALRAVPQRSRETTYRLRMIRADRLLAVPQPAHLVADKCLSAAFVTAGGPSRYLNRYVVFLFLLDWRGWRWGRRSHRCCRRDGCVSCLARFVFRDSEVRVRCCLWRFRLWLRSGSGVLALGTALRPESMGQVIAIQKASYRNLHEVIEIQHRSVHVLTT